MSDAVWTLSELVARVAVTLAGDGYPGAPNGRVRDVPDARAVRWYATIGLMDKPAAMRGRTALYGPRHLLQLVAIKRRQAQGRTIAELQVELAGASDEQLREVAGLDAVPVEAAAAPAARAARAARPGRFWAEPVEAVPAAPPEGDSGPVADTVTVWSGVPLGGGAMLMVPAPPDPDDLHAIAAAAGPLLEVLSARGLLRSPL